jgi:hypothetical protein
VRRLPRPAAKRPFFTLPLGGSAAQRPGRAEAQSDVAICIGTYEMDI